MVQLITLSGEVKHLERKPFIDKDEVHIDNVVLFVPKGTADILNLGDEIEVEVRFEKAVTVVDSVDDLPLEALR